MRFIDYGFITDNVITPPAPSYLKRGESFLDFVQLKFITPPLTLRGGREGLLTIEKDLDQVFRLKERGYRYYRFYFSLITFF